MTLKIKSVLISQPTPASGKSPYFDIAEKYNIQIDFRPFIKVERFDVKEFRQQRINIAEYPIIVFNAKVAIDHFFSMCEEMRVTMSEEARYFCVSESVALYLQKYIQYRKRKIFFSTTGKLDGLNSALKKYSKEKFLIPLSDVHNQEIMQVLDEKKIEYTKAIMYRTVCMDLDQADILKYDVLVFFSRLGITSLLQNCKDFDQKDHKIATFGASTAKTAIEAGLRIDCEAPLPQYPSMTAALEALIKKNHAEHKHATVK